MLLHFRMQRVLLVSLLCLFAKFLDANLIPSKTRVLLQRGTPPSEFECSLSNRELRRFRDQGRWLVDQNGLEALENDLQSLVNCTESDDVLFLNLTTPFQPPRTIILPWSLTISAFIDGRLREGGIISSSRRKVQFQCPGVNEGVFLIESRRSTLANLEFVNCTLNPIEGVESYGIVTLQNCSNTRNQGRVNFHHVEFRNNVLNGSVGIEAISPFCSALELVDVRFRGNLCGGTCAASLSFRNELRQIRVSRNRQSDGLAFAPILFLFPTDSVSSVDGLIASRNDGNIILVRSGEISISNSRFSRNTGGSVELGLYSGGITFINSVGRISDSEFDLHSGIAGSAIFGQGSSLVINRTSFLRSNVTDFGGQLALINCREVEIVDSVFSRSYAGISGGGIYSNYTASLQIRNSTFDRNSANTGGGIYASFGDLTIENSRFLNNIVSTDGAGFYFSEGNLEILQSSFLRNQADRFGGGGYAELCNYSINETELVQNEALTGAGFVLYRSSGPINNSVFSNNSVDRLGGGLYIGVSTFSNLMNCTFIGNFASEGGGFYQDDVLIASLISSQFQYNNASLSGGGASLGTGTYILNSTVFEENFSSEFGGGSTVYDASLNLTGCRFLRNEAGISGAGINIYSETSASFFDSSWIGNHAAENGGGVLMEVSPQLFMQSCTLRSNQANSGAGIEAESTRLTILFSSFTRNQGRRFGSGISVRNGTGRISNSSFSRNSAEFGGALALTEFTGEISYCNFTRNEARTDGGAFYSSSNTRLILQNSSFLMNSASDTGGAMVIRESEISVRNVLFGSNRAVGSGGGIFTGSSVELNLTDSVFQDSISEFYGGAFATSEDTVLRAGNLSIVSCSAVRGGGIYLYRTTGNLTESLFFNNEGSEIGGGIAIINSNLQIQDLNVSMNTALGTVESGGNGGGIIIRDNSIFDFRNLTLMQNRGEFGAGIFIDDFCQGSISRFTAFNNSAFLSGGAVYLDNSNLSINSGEFFENSAFYGGALYVSNGTLVLLESTLINSSSTDAGGGILAQEGSFLTLEDTNLESNSAVNGGGIMLTQSYFWGIRVQFLDCQARVHGGGVGVNETSSFLCSTCLFRGNNAVEEGGAIRLDSPNPQLLAFQLEDSEFHSNHAAFGGGVHFRTGNGSADCSDPNLNSCTFLAMTGCLFHRNHANFTGGAILANDPCAIRISCRSIQKQNRFSFFSRQEFAELTEFRELDVACENWRESNSAESYGPMIGSYARSLSKTVIFEQNSTEIEIPENRFVLRDHPSGVPLPTILLEAVDAFNQGPALIQGNELMEAVMTSPDGLFAGTFTVLMENSRGNFTGVTGFKEPGNYDVRIDFSEESIPTFIIVVEIRRCRIGESKTVNGTFCQICLGDTYNFSPENDDSLCLPCPEDAHCDSVVIRPKSGYWHQTPCSNHLQRCLSERACDEQDRDRKLIELGSSIQNCDFDDEFIGNYTEALCRVGYAGPLCGSCQESFGKSRSFRCEKCYGRFANLLLVFLAALVLLGLTGFAIKSNLPSQRPVIASQVASRRTTETTEDPTINFQMVEMMHTGIVPKELIHPHLRQNQQPNTSRNQQSANRELMKWKTVEVFKITVNYLQVIAIAIAVNVDWTNALILVFEATEFIGGVTSEAATRSTDCLISDDSSVPRSAIRTIVNFIVPGVVGAFFAIFWAISMIKNHLGYNYLAKRCILSALALGYLSYIAITKTSVNILYCIEVHDSVDFEDDSTTKYWAVDTALKCYKGPHTVLASVFGWPVLVLFSLGFPVLVAYVLIMKRSKEGVQSPWLFETAGFLYRSYNPRYIFWESVILLRKAILAVVVVFAYPLGGNLQGILAVCVLMIALYFHIICSPYRSEFDQLNKLEGLSLLISSLTFVSGLFFNDDRTSTDVRALISVFLIFANVGIFLYFLIVFLAAGAQYLRTVLEAEEVDYNQNGGPVYVYKVYLKTRMEKHLGYITQQLSTTRQNQNSRTSEV